MFEPLQTGLISIDSLIPLGRKQRELIISDRQTGKTSTRTDSILNQKFESIVSVYVPIGQKSASVLEVFLVLVRRDAVANLAIVVASASSSAVTQFLHAYTGIAIREFFMLVKEASIFTVLDDLSRHAISYREIYLLLRRPPGREAYLKEIFFVHSRLLERSSKMLHTFNRSSITGIPVIETLARDVSSYIATNVISITDGQIFLSIDLFLSGIKPAIVVRLSVTRVGSAAQWPGIRVVLGSYKLELVQFSELRAFSQFASDLRRETKYRLEKRNKFIELLKQFCSCPLALVCEVSLISYVNHRKFNLVNTSYIINLVSLMCFIPAFIFLILPSKVFSSAAIDLNSP